MSAPAQLPNADLVRSFEAASAGRARAAASRWLGDFNEHGPLSIRRIRVIEQGDRFLAVVVYSEGLDIPPLPEDLPAAVSGPAPRRRGGAAGRIEGNTAA